MVSGEVRHVTLIPSVSVFPLLTRSSPLSLALRLTTEPGSAPPFSSPSEPDRPRAGSGGLRRVLEENVM